MSFDRGVEIDIRNDLAVDDDKRLALEELARVVERATRPEDHRFLDVMKFDSETTAVTQRPPHRLRTVMQVNDDLVDAIRGEVLGDITDEGFSHDWQAGFSTV